MSAAPLTSKETFRNAVPKTSAALCSPLLTSACSSQVVYKQFPSFSLIYSYIPVDVQYLSYSSKNIAQSTHQTTKKKASTFSFYTFATRRKRYIKSSATDWMLV
jgi:hypothetical protein